MARLPQRLQVSSPTPSPNGDVHALLVTTTLPQDETGITFPFDAVRVDFTLKAASLLQITECGEALHHSSTARLIFTTPARLAASMTFVTCLGLTSLWAVN